MPDKSLSKYHPAWNDIDAEVWKLARSFTVPEAAALIANIDPSAISYSKYSPSLTAMNFTDDVRPGRANAIFEVLKTAIIEGELKANFPKPKFEFETIDVAF